MEFFYRLFDTTDFTPRWYCGDWTPAHGYLHIISDLGVWSAYVAIPCVLGYFVLRKKDVPFRTVFWLFGAFILACGTTHLMEAIIFYYPLYRLAGLIKLFTAIVSWGTVIALIPVTPKALAMRSPDELEREIAARTKAEAALQRANAELERRVAERTAELARANAALRSSEERLRLALEAGHMGTWEWNMTTNQVVWSPALEALHGLPPGNFAGTFEAYQQDIHPEDRARVLASIARAAEKGTLHHLEYRIVWPDGSVHWIEARGRLYDGDSGKPQRMTGVCMDIDERKSAEEELRFQAHLLDSVKQAAIATDPAGKVIYWNRFAETLYGWTRAEALHRDILTLTPAPGSVPTAADAMNRLRSGEGWSGELEMQRRDRTTFPAYVTTTPVFNGEGRLQAIVGISTDNTERRRTERTLRFLAEASAALAALVDYRSTLQKVASLAVPFFADWCAIDMLEGDGSLNRLGVAHVDPSKVRLAHELHERYPPDPSAPQGVWQILRTGQSEFFPEIPDALLEERIKDEELLRIIRELGLRSYIGVPLKLRGQTLGVITFITAESRRHYDANDLAVAEDLAHRASVAVENARLYQAVRQADRRKDEFLAMLAHELRNPLAPISNALHVLRLPGADAAITRRAREMMERQVEHLVRLVDDLLDVSRIMRGKVELRREPVELAAVIARAVETSQPVIDAEGHHLTIEVPPQPLWVNGDLVRLAQVVSNLLNNAARYTPRGGSVWVTVSVEPGQPPESDKVTRWQGDKVTKPESAVAAPASAATDPSGHLVTPSPSHPVTPDGHPVTLSPCHPLTVSPLHRVTVSVRDTGIGIAREHLPQLFNMFFQAERRVKDSHGGLGIGLSLVRGLVELHGGTVEARSAGLGQGSEFIVRLPLLERKEGKAAPHRPADAAAGNKLPPHRVLVVDDNVDAADSLAMLLRLEGQQVDVAYDGPTALQKAEARPPTIAFLDLGMPKMDGYDLARAFRVHPVLKATTLIALTGWGQPEDRQRTREAGFDQHLVKPVTTESLHQLLAR